MANYAMNVCDVFFQFVLNLLEVVSKVFHFFQHCLDAFDSISITVYKYADLLVILIFKSP